MKRATEIPTIDVELITIAPSDDPTNEIALDTASQIAVESQIETVDAVKLIVKGVLKAQKPEVSTITGTQITLTDNVFTPELVKILQGGTITTETDGTVTGYTPPTVGSKERGEVFTLSAYSAQYDTAGEIVQYEKITYPNCKGVPVAFSSEDGTFRVSTYTINSAPKTTEAPYKITYVDTLPVIGG